MELGALVCIAKTPLLPLSAQLHLQALFHKEQRWVLPSELSNYPRPKVHIKAMRLFGLSKD